MDELLDKDAKSELESELCINWSEEVQYHNILTNPRHIFTQIANLIMERVMISVLYIFVLNLVHYLCGKNFIQ
jgi:hypothetical protein